MAKLILVIHNIRSSNNVGSLLRTADGLGVSRVIFSGYTPHPKQKDDKRLPHQVAKIDRAIKKTSLGAEVSVKWEYSSDIKPVLQNLSLDGYMIVALEQTEKSVDLNKFKTKKDIALIVGNEVEGVDITVLDLAEKHIHIAMHGKKESFNVAVAGAIAAFKLLNVQ